jgi:hypothetical protein
VIRVARTPEPKAFASVRRRGTRWLAQHPSGEPPSYWRDALPELQAAFGQRCGYSAMHDLNGTVDHFVPRSRDRSLSYEWSNLRYAAQWLNGAKGDREGIIDPFDVEDGWFEVLLPSLQLVVSASAPAAVRHRLETTLRVLPIAHDERIIRQRRAWLKEYEDGHVTLEGLRRFAPLVAAALERQRTAAGKPRGKTKRAPAKRHRPSRSG